MLAMCLSAKQCVLHDPASPRRWRSYLRWRSHLSGVLSRTYMLKSFLMLLFGLALVVSSLHACQGVAHVAHTNSKDLNQLVFSFSVPVLNENGRSFPEQSHSLNFTRRSGGARPDISSRNHTLHFKTGLKKVSVPARAVVYY